MNENAKQITFTIHVLVSSVFISSVYLSAKKHPSVSLTNCNYTALCLFLCTFSYFLMSVNIHLNIYEKSVIILVLVHAFSCMCLNVSFVLAFHFLRVFHVAPIGAL